LGRGQSLADAVREIGQVVESVQTADEVMRLAERHGVELPIAENVRDVLHGDIAPAEGLARLLAREQKAEYPEVLFPQDAKPGR
jgi:glycerol-3-phosphate dehydrogenase (NAD(P)+)